MKAGDGGFTNLRGSTVFHGDFQHAFGLGGRGTRKSAGAIDDTIKSGRRKWRESGTHQVHLTHPDQAIQNLNAHGHLHFKLSLLLLHNRPVLFGREAVLDAPGS